MKQRCPPSKSSQSLSLHKPLMSLIISSTNRETLNTQCYWIQPLTLVGSQVLDRNRELCFHSCIDAEQSTCKDRQSWSSWSQYSSAKTTLIKVLFLTCWQFVRSLLGSEVGMDLTSYRIEHFQAQRAFTGGVWWVWIWIFSCPHSIRS